MSDGVFDGIAEGPRLGLSLGAAEGTLDDSSVSAIMASKVLLEIVGAALVGSGISWKSPAHFSSLSPSHKGSMKHRLVAAIFSS